MKTNPISFSGLLQANFKYINTSQIKKISCVGRDLDKTRVEYSNGDTEDFNVDGNYFADCFLKAERNPNTAISIYPPIKRQ